MATVFTQTALTMDTIDEILPTPQLEEKNRMSNLQVTSHVEWNLSQNSANSILCQPFKLQYFSALPDQMAANFRKLGIQKSTMIHDIFNWKPDQQPSSRKPCRLWNNPSIKILLKTAGIHYHKRKKF